MGICTSDPLTYLIKQYGGDVCKYFVAEKSQEFLDKSTPKFTQRVQEQFKNTSQNLDKQFDDKQKTLKGNFENAVSDIKKQNPAALQTVKKSQNKNQQELFGFNSLSAQFTKLKSAKDGKIKDQQQNLIRLIQEKKQDIRKSIKDNKPSLPLFDQMPICVKQTVISQAQEKFAPQIKGGQQKITSIFESTANINNLEKDIKNVSGINAADKLVKDSQDVFYKAKRMISLTSNPKSCFG